MIWLQDNGLKIEFNLIKRFDQEFFGNATRKNFHCIWIWFCYTKQEFMLRIGFGFDWKVY